MEVKQERRLIKRTATCRIALEQDEEGRKRKKRENEKTRNKAAPRVQMPDPARGRTKREGLAAGCWMLQRKKEEAAEIQDRGRIGWSWRDGV